MLYLIKIRITKLIYAEPNYDKNIKLKLIYKEILHT